MDGSCSVGSVHSAHTRSVLPTSWHAMTRTPSAPGATAPARLANGAVAQTRPPTRNEPDRCLPRNHPPQEPRAATRRSEIQSFVRGLVDRSWSEGQIAAFAMAVCLRGMGRGCVALTQAMTDSGDRLDWSRAKLHGPLLDKHSTGGVGDKTSLVLAPLVAACGGVVPMVSGRGLGHPAARSTNSRPCPATVTPRRATLVRVLREGGLRDRRRERAHRAGGPAPLRHPAMSPRRWNRCR